MPSRKNFAEREIREKLEADGWEVFAKGWPDYLAVKGDVVRFIEVKSAGQSQLSTAQQVVFDILTKLGLTVEVQRASVRGTEPKRKLPIVHFTRLGDGTWGVKGPKRIVVPGNRVYVARRGFEPKPIRVGQVLWGGQRVVIAAFQNED